MSLKSTKELALELGVDSEKLRHRLKVLYKADTKRGRGAACLWNKKQVAAILKRHAEGTLLLKRGGGSKLRVGRKKKAADE